MKTFASGNYTAKAWYLYGGTLVGFGPTLSPGSSVSVNAPVNVVRVTLY